MTAAEFKSIRARLGLTQSELARALRLGANGERTVRRWETGKIPVTGPASVVLDMLVNDHVFALRRPTISDPRGQDRRDVGHPSGDSMNALVKLTECPIGLFLFIGDDHKTLALKTEYSTNEGVPHCYIVSSGESFWGPAPQTKASLMNCMVRPISDEIVDLLEA